MFEGIIGSTSRTYLGDIAIDDVSVTQGACPGVGSCDFETDNCGWIQRRDDVFDWTRKRGPTSSSQTGPATDHTTGTTTG